VLFALLLTATLASGTPATDIQGELVLERVRLHVPTSRIIVKGWAVSRCGAPEVALLVDERELARAKPWMTDQAISARFPAEWGGGTPRFEAEIDPLNYATGMHHVRIVARAGECGERLIGDQTFITVAAPPGWMAWAILLGALALAWGVASLLQRLPRGTHRVPLFIGVGLLLATSFAAILLGLPSIGIKDHPVFDALSKWDGQFYLLIARKGYAAAGNSTYGFFPMYPLVLRVLDPIPGPAELPAAILNAALFAASIWMLRRLLPDGDSGLLAYAALPYAFFFVAVYTESLALFLSILFVTLLRGRKGWLAFLAGVLAGLTRPQCVALSLFAIEDLRAKRKTALAAFGPIVGAASYAGYLWWATGNPMKYAEAQAAYTRSSHFSAGRLLQVLARVWPTRDQWGLVDLITLIIVVIGACALVRIGRVAEGLFCAAVVLIPLATLSLMGIHRYALLAFPLFPYLAGFFRNRWAYWLLIAAEAWFLVQYALNFGRGNFVG